MNCPTIDKLSQYVDNLLTEQELVDQHSCKRLRLQTHCRRAYEDRSFYINLTNTGTSR